MINDLSFFYVVGGQDQHYKNLLNSIRSIKRLIAKPKIKIFEFGNSLKSCEDYEVINGALLDLSPNRKIGYQFWRMKYYAALNISTKWGVYVDSDTVLVNDRFEELCLKLNGKIGAAQHFYVPTFSDFFQKAVPPQNKNAFIDICNQLDISGGSRFYSGGIFLFENTEENKLFFQSVLQAYDACYNNGTDYIKGITDEVFLSGIEPARIVNLGGALNHCVMGEEHMNLRINPLNDTLEGKNTYDLEYKPISFLHCDCSRRDPTKTYEMELKKKIEILFFGETR